MVMWYWCVVCVCDGAVCVVYVVFVLVVFLWCVMCAHDTDSVL